MNRNLSLIRLICAVMIVICGTMLFKTSAKANYFDDFYNGVETFSGLPSEVNRLKESYRETLDDLDRAQADAKQYQEQNAELMAQNKELSETVQALQETNQARAAREHKLKVMLVTVVALAAGYFVFIRIMRYFMRRANRI
ncbi:hypothetical protein [Paenibacillus cineris]|uniref:hypothetical protein n=1 Tax=Paenibacillus cineris TaxID=237530 RepID=UPI001B2B6680|nr:hypothetical protein [Paenibacillus cineris]GIO64632.1 hypothetical protein J43TS9_62060 [Paenibacillus cineris]